MYKKSARRSAEKRLSADRSKKSIEGKNAITFLDGYTAEMEPGQRWSEKEMDYFDDLELQHVSQLRKKFQDLLTEYPEALQLDEDWQGAWRDHTAREAAIERITARRLLENIGILQSEYVVDEKGRFHLSFTESPTDIQLPTGYGLKGGEARIRLLRALRRDNNAQARDSDIVYFLSDGEEIPKDEQAELAKKYMSDDYAGGSGIENITDVDNYFATRDFTLNEVLTNGTTVIATPACISDTLRGILRITAFEKDRMYPGSNKAQKILSKTLRFYAKGIAEDALLQIAEEDQQYIATISIKPFFLALQLDRAYELGDNVAQTFVQLLRVQRMIPQHLHTPRDTAQWLQQQLGDDSYYFRNAPIQEWECDKQMLKTLADIDTYDDYGTEHLPHKLPFGRSAGKK